MAERSERAVLNHLIEINRDAERGFRTAAGQVQSAELKALFTRLAEQRREFADALLPHAQRLGGPQMADGSNAGAVHRALMRMRARLSADRDHAVLDEASRGERFAVAAYENAVNDMLPPDTRDLVEAQDAKLRAAAKLVFSTEAFTEPER
jgi:uncharacterized protein (TIGR02284 family)